MLAVPESVVERAYHLLVTLLAEQEHVKVEYEIVKNEEKEKGTA